MPFMIEGEWRGYRSSQDHVVHRTFTSNRKWAERVKAIGYGIEFSDGTMLILRVTEFKGRRKSNWREIHGYDALISDCARYGVHSVIAVNAARDLEKTARENVRREQALESACL